VAPDRGRRAAGLNPAEGIWPVPKQSPANLVKRDIDQLTALLKTRLKRLQY
jgi:hypothetical protein